jgi:hypothetical protein
MGKLTSFVQRDEWYDAKDNEVAAAYLDWVLNDEDIDPEDELFSLVVDEVRRRRRALVRQREREVIITQQQMVRTGGVAATIANFQTTGFRDLPFTLPGGRRVVWGLATVEEHEERVRMLQRHQVALGESIDQHQYAIRLISANPGANCLNDVYHDRPVRVAPVA